MAPEPGGPRPGGSGSVVYLVIGLVLITMVAGIAIGFASSDDDSADARGASAASDSGDSSDAGANPGGAGAGVPETPTTVATAPTTLPPAPAAAAVNDCVHVTVGGSLSGTGSCSGGGTPYMVTEVLPAGGVCSHPNASWMTSGDHVLCMQVNLIETYCYDIPDADLAWITPSTCELPGTQHVIDVVPGATSDTACTTDYQWNRWYNIPYPQQIVCVMAY